MDETDIAFAEVVANLVGTSPEEVVSSTLEWANGKLGTEHKDLSDISAVELQQIASQVIGNLQPRIVHVIKIDIPSDVIQEILDELSDDEN